MRILILSVPFLGVEEIGKAISLDLGYTNFVSDPMNLDFYGTTIRHYYHIFTLMMFLIIQCLHTM